METSTAVAFEEGAVHPIRPRVRELLNQENDELGEGGDPVEEAEVVEDDEVGEEVDAPRPRKAPMTPSADAVARHRITGHAVYRSWCRECVQGRGRNAPHAQKPEAKGTVPVISFDYGFLGSRGQDQDAECEEEGHTPFLAFQDSCSKGVYSRLVPHKGVDHPQSHLTLKKVCQDLDNLGYKRVIFRSDGEPAIRAFLAAVKLAWDGEVVPEASSPGESQSHGAAEKAVQVVKGVYRTVLFSLEANLKTEVPEYHPICTWALTYSSSCQRRYAIGVDGFTAYEKTYGGKPRNQAVEFGEKVWWRPLQPSNKRLRSQAPRFEEGFFLGPIDGSTSVAISTLSGDVVQTRAMKRRATEERWDPEGLLKLKVCELQPNGDSSDDGRYKIRAPTLREAIPEEELPQRMDADPEYRP